MNESHIYTIHNKPDIIHSLDTILNEHKMILLGEATHGTKEFYEYRFEIVKHVVDNGFVWIFFEADWDHIYELNRFIHNNGSFKTCIESMHRIKKFPLWMVRNSVICNMLKWMKEYNRINHHTKLYEGIVFMGVDCYDDYYSKKLLSKNGIDTADISELEKLYASYIEQLTLSDNNRWELLRTAQCLKVLIGNYYYFTNPNNENTWDIRDRHWLDMIKNVELFAGNSFRGVLWAHNSHVGDTSNQLEDTKVNIGQLVRDYYGKENVLLIGFITYSGTVRAADQWGSTSKVKRLNIPDNDTYSYLFHTLVDIYGKEFAIILSNSTTITSLYQRDIGVIYKQDTSRVSHYSKSDIHQRFDMVYYIDTTTAIDKI
jgi:erythromycin esterase-like protein